MSKSISICTNIKNGNVYVNNKLLRGTKRDTGLRYYIVTSKNYNDILISFKNGKGIKVYFFTGEEQEKIQKFLDK